MSHAERYDILILGSGEAGKFLAWHMARAGHRTAVVERRWIGGSCPNINCLPSKNEIWSAKVADLAHHGARYGTMTGPVTVDMARVRQRKREMVEGMIAAESAELQGERRRADHGKRPLHGAEDPRGHPERGRNAAADRREGLSQSRHPCGDPRSSRPRGRRPPDEHRGPGARPSAGASDRAGRRLCRAGAGPGLSPLRQRGDAHRAGSRRS